MRVLGVAREFRGELRLPSVSAMPRAITEQKQKMKSVSISFEKIIDNFSHH